MPIRAKIGRGSPISHFSAPVAGDRDPARPAEAAGHMGVLTPRQRLPVRPYFDFSAGLPRYHRCIKPRVAHDEG
jgi:hypothetical protein